MWCKIVVCIFLHNSHLLLYSDTRANQCDIPPGMPAPYLRVNDIKIDNNRERIERVTPYD